MQGGNVLNELITRRERINSALLSRLSSSEAQASSYITSEIQSLHAGPLRKPEYKTNNDLFEKSHTAKKCTRLILP